MRITSRATRLCACATAATAVVAAGCGAPGRSLSADELALLERVGLGDSAVTRVLDQMDREISPFYGGDENETPGSTAGVAIGVPYGWAEAFLDSLRSGLEGHDVGVFYATRRFGFSAMDSLAVVPTVDPYAYLALVRTHGLAMDITHDSVVAQLRSWDAEFGLEYLGASTDWVRFRFDPDQNDADRLVREVMDFCPDIWGEGPGPGSHAEVLRDIRTSGRATCWWRGG